LDDRALELREHAEHLEERLAGRRAGIDALAIEVQVNPGAVQLAAKAGTLSSVWMRSRREVR
jgi:hypothetical protein